MFRTQQPRPMLSPRESEILVGAGAMATPASRLPGTLDLCVRTVETHRQSIKRRLGLEGQSALINYAVEHARGLQDDS